MKKIFYTIAVACILAACTEDLDEWTTSPSGIQTGADYVLSGKEGYRSLGLDARDVVGGETEGGFLTFVERDGKAWLYVEQNDDGAPRSGCVRLRLADGETRRLTVSQATRDVDLQENIDQGFIRNYGVGYSFEGYNGEKCSFNSVMSQVVNFETLRKVEAQESVELLSTDYRHQGYYETASGYSLSEYVHNVDFGAKGEANLILYKGSVMKNLSVLEVVDKKAFYVSSSYISPKGVRTLNTEDLKAYVAQYPNLLTQSFRKAVEDLSRHPSDIMALDSFLVRFGTHVVSSSTLGGKLDLYVSVSQESFDTYEQEQTFAKNAVPLLFKKMSSSGSDYNFKDVFNTAESRMEAYGGRISILNEAVVNPDFNNSRLQPKLLADWEASIEYDEDSYAGNNVEMVDMPSLKYAMPAYYVLATSEASTNLARYVGMRYGRQDGDYTQKFDEFFSGVRSRYFGDEAKRRILLGTFTRMAGYSDRYYSKAREIRQVVIQDYKSVLKDHDAVLAPTMPFTAPRFDDISKMSALDNYKADYLTVPANIAGTPHMSVPCGYGSDGMPIGMQFVADHWDEDVLFSMAEAWEREFEIRRPEVAQ